ncbi:hypothetical protein C0Q70_00739 [Pomacea canaliculata]|uniref:DNA-directed RNA polymerase III subunit RPC4 n=1 Tax=Pomacea canaliculata TaxID=400727 RepID=A0A2T7PXJ7_POMCA|nr:hypothetical protein C0Q70_00739 [Pomacea canaliculata]
MQHFSGGSSSYDGRVGGGFSGGKGGAPARVKQENARRGGEIQNQTLDHLLRDDFIADGPEDDPDMIPVMLPMSSVAMEELKREQKGISGDATIHIKQEPMDCDNEGSKYQPTQTPTSFTKEETIHHKKEDRMSVNYLLNSVAKSEKEELIFLQLPDVLPGVPKGLQLGLSDGSTGTANKENRENDELEKKMGACSLDHFSEGYVGKLRVRKSGKAELVLGDIVLDVTMGTSCGFLQDVVSVRTGENDKHMTVLGHLSHRLICSPNFEYLFNI